MYVVKNNVQPILFVANCILSVDLSIPGKPLNDLLHSKFTKVLLVKVHFPKIYLPFFNLTWYS